VSETPRILLTNDDGAHARGLRAAYDSLKAFADVTVVAPSNQRSGASHSITLDTPLRAHPLKTLPGFRVDFSPVDCVKLGLSHLFEGRPQLVVSGINRGSNGGQLAHYSGTVAAAKEAALAGVPAVAFSLAQWRKPDFSAAARVTSLVVQRVLAEGLPPGVILNVKMTTVHRRVHQ
jgi:5'-nucleotidase